MAIFSLIGIVIISLFALYPSFNLALLGDDWLAFFRYLQLLGPKSTGQWNHLTYFLTPYGAQDIWMAFLQKIWGYNSTLFYLTSYILRMLAAFSLYPLVLYITKSKLSAIFAVIFFSVTVVGFDTTNWSSNMTTYITVTFFNLFLYFFLKAREQTNIKTFLLALLLYYLAYITAPIRMHGSMLFIFLLEIFWIIQDKKIEVAKKVLWRIGLLIAVFLIVRYTGNSQGPAQEAAERFHLGINAMSEMLRAGRFDFLFYPIIMFGSMIIPDFILSSRQIITKSSLLFSVLIPIFSVFTIFAALLLKDIQNGLKSFNKIIISAVCWVLIVIFTFMTNMTTLNDSRYITLLLVGGFGIILIVSLITKFFRQKNLANGLFIGLFWSILSFFFAWWWVPTSIFPTTYRYLIVSAVGISVLFGTLISLGKQKRQILIFILLGLILTVHIISTRMYLNSLLNSHGQDITNKIWGSIPYVEEVGKSKEPLIFYFEGDNSNAVILHDVVTFGFPPHMALLYNLTEGDGLPVPMSELNELVAAVIDGKPMRAYGYPIKPVPPERVYAFKLQGRDNLINITDEVRQKLKQIQQSQSSTK